MGEAVAHRVAGERDVLEPVETPLRAHPEAALPVFVEAGHVVVGQAVTAGERHEALAAHPQQPLAERADPEVSVAVLPDDPGGVGGEAVLAGEVGDPAVLDAREAAARADPDRPRAVLEDRVDERMREGRARAVTHELRALQHGQALGGAEPDVASAVLEDGGDGVPRRDGLLVGHAPAAAEAPEAASERTYLSERSLDGDGGWKGRMTPCSSRATPPAAVPIQRAPSRPWLRARILASLRPGVLPGSKTVKRTPSKRKSPPRLPIQR